MMEHQETKAELEKSRGDAGHRPETAGWHFSSFRPIRLDRYILKQFFLGAMVAMVAFIIIYIAVDLMEKLDKFLDHKLSFKMVVEYYVNFMPQIIALILPVCLLLGSLFTTARMSTQNEIIAMRSAGMSLYRLMAPFIVASTLISAVAVYFDGWVLPKANARVEEILRDYVHEDIINNSEFDMYLQDSPTRIVSMSDYSTGQKRANRVSVQDFDPKNTIHMMRRTDAQLMTWDSVKRQWHLQDATERTFVSDTSGERMRHLSSQESYEAFTFTPGELMDRLLKMDEMTNTELARRIALKRKSGQDVARDEVDYQSKYSLAFTSLIVVLFGVPFASKKKRGGLSFEFSIAIGIAFAFLTFSKVSQTFGYTGLAAPWVTAWLANILFFAGSIVVIWKAQK
jgi:lipopolysaccharide export system permease protein